MKKNFIRTISLVLALVMSLSLMTTAFAAETDVDTDSDDLVVWYDENGNPVEFDADGNAIITDDDLALVTSFKDVKSSAWYYNDVTECAKLGIVSGYSDGTFKPENKVTYVEFGTMITRTFYSADIDKVTDTANKPWYYPNMKVMRDKNLDANTYIVSQGGWPSINCADKATTRYEMALMLYNVMKNKGATSKVTYNDLKAARKTIKDYETVSNANKGTYTLPIQYCVALGIITGMSDGTFSGAQNMTRAQACTVMVRMLKLINQYNVGDKDNDQYDDGTSQNTGNNQNTSNKTDYTGANAENGLLTNGKPITPENVIERLADLKKIYPKWVDATGPVNGMYAYGRNTTCYACAASAVRISDFLFGQNSKANKARTLTTFDATQLKPGDLIEVFGNGFDKPSTHSAVISGKLTTDEYGRPAYPKTDNTGWTGYAAIEAAHLWKVITRYPA